MHTFDLKTYMPFCTSLDFNGTGVQQRHILWGLKIFFLDAEIEGMNQNTSGIQMRGDYLRLRCRQAVRSEKQQRPHPES